jgi:branched-chain amino acid transport system ATP-binding protein
MLNVSNLSSNYGNIQAVRHIDLSVPEGAMVALIGANGSGKSTTLKTIAGMHPPASGSVVFKGVDITGWSTHKLVRHGVAFLMERPISVVAPLTVEENLGLAAAAGRTDIGSHLDRMYEIFPRLRDRRNQHAGTLSGGEQQMVAIARVLMTGPELLLIDSPAIGLAPAIVDEVYATIVVSDYTYLLHRGEIAVEGPSSELRGSKDVVEAYLA